MPRPNATARFIHTLVIGGAFAGAVLAAGVSAANAMQIFNCTNQPIPVSVVHTPSGQHFGTATVAPRQGMNWHTGEGSGYQVGVQSAELLKQYDNRQGNEILSIAVVNGQKQLMLGHQCGQSSQPVRSRPPAPGAAPAAPNPSAGDVIKGVLAAATIGILLHNATN